MGLDGHRDVKVSLGAALDSMFTFVRETEAHARFDASWNLHRQHAFFAEALAPAASRTWLRNDLTCAFALTAGTADAEKALLEAQLALPLTGGAHLDGRG